MAKILLVDDDPQALESTCRILTLDGHMVIKARDGQEGLDQVRGSGADLDLVLSDVRMPRLGGVEFLRALLVMDNQLPVILMTAYGRIEEAVWAMKLGAVDFLTKPFKRQALRMALESALRRRGPKLKLSSAADEIIGSSLSMKALRETISQLAASDATVLILGESGTGKELIAKNIHRLSARSGGPFIALNCAAIPENLIEAELFGFEKGAFSGAERAHAGLFESADGGVMFLDEIGDMPVQLQAKLLRVLQEGEVRRIGASASKKINVRILAATHQDLLKRIEEKRFREDLYFRLNVMEVKAPPLGERREDIAELAQFFIQRACSRHEKPMKTIAPQAMETLRAYHWPGNVRELANVLERAVVLSPAAQITQGDLPEHLRTQDVLSKSQASGQGITLPLGTSLKEAESLIIQKTLEATSGDKNLTAKILGINSRTIYRRLEKPKTQS